jgi:protein O-GlcNAc transferase
MRNAMRKPMQGQRGPSPSGKLERALALHRQGQLAEAERLYRQILRTNPGHFDALRLLGVIRFQHNAYQESADLLAAALRQNPRSAEVLSNLGLCLARLGRHEEAVGCHDRALAIDPGFVEALNNRGVALYEMQRFADALASHERALAMRPDHADAHYNRGNALHGLKRIAEALASYDKALAIRPSHAEALNNRGAVLRDLKRFEEALASCDKALAIKPDNAEMHSNRANTLRDLRRFDEALAGYDRVLAIRADYVEALYNRATTLREMRRYAQAIADLERVLQIRPDYPYALGQLIYARMHCCDWRMRAPELARLGAEIQAGRRVSFPFILLSLSASSAEQRRCAEIYAENRYPASPVPIWRGERYRHDRIRVAYLSADFRDHAVSYLLAGLFERHDRARFETIAIDFTPDAASKMRPRVLGAFDHVIDVRARSDGEVARLIREREVDIAVDLMGFTQDSRTAILALRPAPVQVNYLGYAGTMGARYIDYIIADRVVVPDSEHRHYGEKVVALPDTFMGSDCTRAIAERTPSRAELSLPQRGFVLCSFNNSYKIAPQMFDIWMRLLRAVEGSVLWLSQANDIAAGNLRREAQARGVEPDRLIFASRTARPEDHLARLRAADLFVDTLPYNAHTTASDALWAGLPIVTCLGTTFAGRVAGSLLMAIGLPELVTHTLADYEALALRLPGDPQRLAALRDMLARNRQTHALFDTDRFRRHIEAAYTTMWERTQRGEPPASFAVEP